MKKKLILRIIVLTVIYFIAAKLGLKLAFVQPNATAVWPPTGIALAALLLFGYDLWPGVFLGAFFANITTAGSLVTSFGIASGNTLEALVNVYLVSRFANGLRVFDRPQDIFKFVLIAGLGSTVSATIGVTSLALGGYASWTLYHSVWVTWWLGDLGGALVIAPFLFLITKKTDIQWSLYRVLELFLVFLTLIIVSFVLFAGGVPRGSPIGFVAIPVLVWVAFRFGQRETIIAIFLLSLIAVSGTLQGYGPFAISGRNESLLLLQIYIVIIAVAKMVLSAAVLQRNEAEQMKTNFFAMAAHRLRSPLSSMRWSLELLLTKDKDKLSPEVEEGSRLIYRDTKFLIDEVSEILNIARADKHILPGKVREINVVELIKDVADEIRLEAKQQGVTIAIKKTQQESPMIFIDSIHFSEIMHNLISNATRYSKKNGKVAIDILEKKDTIIISISDQGIGISDEEKDKVFEKYFRTKSAQVVNPEGSGLGLSLVKSYVDLWGGKVWFESKEGKGTTFYIQIPKKIQSKSN